MTMSREKLVVIGQGYVGLPLAMRAVEAGYDVVGFDVDDDRVDALAAGRVLRRGHHRRPARAPRSPPAATAPPGDRTTAAGFDVAIISVPTPLREALPDLTYIEEAARLAGAHLDARVRR